ncbi:MAG: tRNA (adenosine(37)-N6)-threonylcarbamoyltransferase complex transferase subunit TsaD, partial [Candidatus Hydrogenedentota bacterium]
AVIETLARKTQAALRKAKVRRMVVTGGVAANESLRARLRRIAEAECVDCLFPQKRHCTDNAAMIGAAFWARKRVPLRENEGADASLPLPQTLSATTP